MFEDSNSHADFFGYKLTNEDKITIVCPQYTYIIITNICYGELINNTEPNDVFLDFCTSHSDEDGGVKNTGNETKTIKLTRLVPNTFEHVSVNNVFSRSNVRLVLYTHGPNPVYVSGYFESIPLFEEDTEDDLSSFVGECFESEETSEEEEEKLTEEQKKSLDEDKKEEDVTKSLMEYVENKRVIENAKK